MKISGLTENEQAALSKLKKALASRSDLLDFRVFGPKARDSNKAFELRQRGDYREYIELTHE